MKRVLAVWCVAVVAAASIAARVHTEPHRDVVAARDVPSTSLAVPLSSTTTTSTTPPAPTETSSTLPGSIGGDDARGDQPAPDAGASAPSLDRSGVWLVRPDGSDAVYVGDHLANAWYDDGSLYSLDAQAGDVVLVRLDGSEQTLSAPDGPRWNGPGTQARRILQLSVGGGRVVYQWVHRDDPGGGVSVAPADLSSAVDLGHGGNVSISPRGDRVVVGDGSGVWVYDGDGHLLGGPLHPGQPASFGTWSADDHHVMLLLDSTTTCVLDLMDGSCVATPLGHDDAIGAPLLSDGATLAAGVFEMGAEDDRLVVGPYGGPLVTIASHARFEFASPRDDRILYSDFPFFHRDRPSHVHVIDADGSADRVIATTPAGMLATTCGFAPNGQWVLVRVFVNQGGG